MFQFIYATFLGCMSCVRVFHKCVGKPEEDLENV